MRITLADHGRSFSTRARAELIAGRVKGGGSPVVLDFAGVGHVSGSFIDELLRQTEDDVEVIGLESAEVKRIVAQVAYRRGVSLQPL